MTTTTQIKKTQPTETANYIVCYNHQKQEWELRGKMGNRTYFIARCEFQVPLIVKQNRLEAKFG